MVEEEVEEMPEDFEGYVISDVGSRERLTCSDLVESPRVPLPTGCRLGRS